MFLNCEPRLRLVLYLVTNTMTDIGKPSLYLPVCMLIWGAISCLTGITHKYVS
jgi:hypothetical protein